MKQRPDLFGTSKRSIWIFGDDSNTKKVEKQTCQNLVKKFDCGEECFDYVSIMTIFLTNSRG